jgi:hypothetical protein
LKVSVATRLILNERILAFPYGQHAPASVLDAAFELGKQSALAGVDENPFFSTRARTSQRPAWHQRYVIDPHRGAEAVAWLRGHYLASKAVVLREAA